MIITKMTTESGGDNSIAVDSSSVQAGESAPVPAEMDKMQVEAQLERDVELESYELRRIAANLKLKIAENLGNKELIERTQADIQNIEHGVSGSVEAVKRDMLSIIENIFDSMDSAMSGNSDGFLLRMANKMSVGAFRYLAHLMEKEVRLSKGVQASLEIPILTNAAGRLVFLALTDDGALLLRAEKR
ncbi:MAG: hypothetical protein UT53_C0014G0001 [Candidatus Yanofskybacteria bacterium GW2011_GWD2_39_48]|uniref:Uncharacterized protein n=1 Tax=Candidatus Yanofskybacteria bacterium GW2011_GWD2_39_48 TaxID=1619031 RepID=A0A0G0P6D3_9BACT|nr:MAG: hypothetical protein UT53_C0014G0001 [Candidatus Yanofskybacteria bacterium GW2011_GWD2_39_48]